MEPLSLACRPACRHNLFGERILTSIVNCLHNGLVKIGSGTGARMTPMMGSSGVLVMSDALRCESDALGLYLLCGS